MDPVDLPAHALSRLIHARELSCRELMAATLARIGVANPVHNAIVSLRDGDALLQEAERFDAMLARGESRGWMHGLPQAIKDISHAAGLPTTLGSPLMRDFVASEDGLMAQRMKAAGCIVIGKTNTPEFGLGSHTFNEVFGVTRNAWDASRSAGGSSGGAAVALATRMLSVADGSDSMGSLRNPAGWNNVFGMRPSQGRVPFWPAADGWVTQLGTEGPMGRTVRDVALLLETQSGYDARVPLSIADRPAFATALDRADARGVRIGWLADLGGHLAMEPGVLDVCERALKRLEGIGCAVEPLALGHSAPAVWEAWLVWRRWLVAARVAPFLAKPENRAQIKPEALWEHDQGDGLRGDAGDGGKHRAQPLPAEPAEAVRARGCARAAVGAGVAVPGRVALAAAHRRDRDGHLPPLDGGDAVRDLRRPAGDLRARRLQRGEPADGAAADRPAAGRCRVAATRPRVRAGGGGGRAQAAVSALPMLLRSSIRPTST